MARRRFAAAMQGQISPFAENATQPDIAPPAPPAESTREKTIESKAEKEAEARTAAAKVKLVDNVPGEIRQFCANTASAVVDARVAWQAARLTELEAKLRQRIAEFEIKQAEYQDWLHKHDEALKEAKEDVVAIYSKMRPDAAAAQLAVMDDVLAASLLSKLNARVASSILAEMNPDQAARIANAMIGPASAAGGKKS